jgi:hypothetical protein
MRDAAIKPDCAPPPNHHIAAGAHQASASVHAPSLGQRALHVGRGVRVAADRGIQPLLREELTPGTLGRRLEKERIGEQTLQQLRNNVTQRRECPVPIKGFGQVARRV